MSKKRLGRKKIMGSTETATKSTSAIETKTTELIRLLRPNCVHHVHHVASENPASVQAGDVASGSSAGEGEGERADAGSSRLSGKTTSTATPSLWSTPVTATTVVSTSAVSTPTSIDAAPDLPIPHPPLRPGYIPQQRGLVNYVTRTPAEQDLYAPRSRPIMTFEKIIYTIVDCQFFLSLFTVERVLPASQVPEYLTPDQRALVGNIPSDLLTAATSPLPSPSPPKSAASQASTSPSAATYAQATSNPYSPISAASPFHSSTLLDRALEYLRALSKDSAMLKQILDGDTEFERICSKSSTPHRSPT
ncbi:hypothetical protein EV361DRAFT_953019 [Lentinula raphanica]|nr:hypothetical protein EV361DRAFT_953019 [Lentinula raphanica]